MFGCGENNFQFIEIIECKLAAFSKLAENLFLKFYTTISYCNNCYSLVTTTIIITNELYEDNNNGEFQRNASKQQNSPQSYFKVD